MSVQNKTSELFVPASKGLSRQSYLGPGELQRLIPVSPQELCPLVPCLKQFISLHTVKNVPRCSITHEAQL